MFQDRLKARTGLLRFLAAGTVHSSIGNNFLYLVNPYDITLSSSPTATSYDSNSKLDANFNLNDLSSYSQIDLQSLDNIELSSSWTLTDPGVAAALNLTAGNKLTLDDETAIVGGNNWSVNLTAGTQLPSGSLPASGKYGIYLNGSSYIQTQNGSISLYAANEVIVNSGAVRTIGGGGINVTTLYGDVNSGTSTSGFNYISKAPYFSPFSVTGFGNFASLAPVQALEASAPLAGGNVTINAGGNVISYLPFGTGAAGSPATSDAGTGAFGSQPGNVTMNAGGSVYGHYVAVNGTGTINASQNIGSSSQNVALSLVTGGWNLDAQNGNIYLQEVRNPNGDFNITGSAGSGGNHFFDYDPSASVSLTAGIGVYLTGQNLPRASVNGSVDNIQIIMPPSLDISAGSGGVTLENDFTLFPSSDGNGDLQITTTDGGNFNGEDASGNLTEHQLLMSDSSQTHWLNSPSGIQPFSALDYGNTPSELNNYDPALINIAGSMNNIVLQTTKETQITVGGDMTGCSFYGQNLHDRRHHLN